MLQMAMTCFSDEWSVLHTTLSKYVNLLHSYVSVFDSKKTFNALVKKSNNKKQKQNIYFVEKEDLLYVTMYIVTLTYTWVAMRGGKWESVASLRS